MSQQSSIFLQTGLRERPSLFGTLWFNRICSLISEPAAFTLAREAFGAQLIPRSCGVSHSSVQNKKWFIAMALTAAVPTSLSDLQLVSSRMVIFLRPDDDDTWPTVGYSKHLVLASLFHHLLTVPNLRPLSRRRPIKGSKRCLARYIQCLPQHFVARQNAVNEIEAFQLGVERL